MCIKVYIYVYIGAYEVRMFIYIISIYRCKSYLYACVYMCANVCNTLMSLYMWCIYCMLYISHVYMCRNYSVHLYTAISYTPILLYRYARVNRTKYSSFRGASVYSTEGPEVYAGILRQHHNHSTSSGSSSGSHSIHTTQVVVDGDEDGDVLNNTTTTTTSSNSSSTGVIDSVFRRRRGIQG